MLTQIIRPDGNLYVELDGRGQYSMTCQRCGLASGTFSPDLVNPWLEQHQRPMYYGTDIEGKSHWGGPKQCGQTVEHKEHGWQDAAEMTWTCVGLKEA